MSGYWYLMVGDGYGEGNYDSNIKIFLYIIRIPNHSWKRLLKPQYPTAMLALWCHL